MVIGRIQMNTSPMPESGPMRPTLRSFSAAMPWRCPLSSMARPAPRSRPETGGVALKTQSSWLSIAVLKESWSLP